MVSLFQMSTILVMLIIQFHLSRSANENCKEAIKNAEDVESCPTSKEEWDIAARKKNCSEMAAVTEGKNCTINEKKPEYHCLINAFRNKFLEVCIVAKTIFGHCAEYNEVGNLIQNHYAAPCGNVFPKCDDSYSSSDAYKYPDCYNLVNQAHVPRDLELGKIIISTCTAFIVLCCLVAFIALLWTKKRNENRENPDEERRCLEKFAAENTENKGVGSNPSIQYFYFKIKTFDHLFYFHNNINKCKQRIMEKMKNMSHDFTNVATNIVTKDGFVKIGVIGKYTDEDLLLFPKGKTIKEYENENPLKAVPVLCFQNNIPLQSALEACRSEDACHLIFIKPVLDVQDKSTDSVIFVDRNKTDILEAITSCLEQPLCNMLDEWLHLYSEDSEIHSVIKVLCMSKLNHNNETDTPEVPDKIKMYLSRRSDVVSYTLTDSTLQVSVTKATDEKKLKNELMELDPRFFEKCIPLIDKRKSIKRNTGSLVKKDDIDWNLASSTASFDSTKQNETVNIVMDPTKHQQVDNKKSETSVCLEKNRYEDAGKNTKSKLHNPSLSSISSSSSNVNSDDSKDLDFDNSNAF